MATWSAPKTNFAAGDVVSYSHLNAYANDLTCLTEASSYFFARASSPDASTANTTFTDIAGCTFTLAKPGTWLVGFSANCASSSSVDARFTISNAGVDDANEAKCSTPTYITISNLYTVTVTTSNAIKLRYRSTSGSFTIAYRYLATSLWARWLGP